MEAILCCLSGIFIGLTTSWYFQIKPMSQLKSENSDLRQELEDIKFDLSVVNKEVEQKDEIVKKMKIVINDFMTKEDKLNKIKELADDYQSIN